MPINVRYIDSKFKTKKSKDMKRQIEFDGMERHASESAVQRFKAEPYQLQYQRMMRKQHENNA